MSAAGAAHRTGLQRVCFQLQVRPELIPEYRRRHAAVWPEMLRALKAADWNNYSLFLRDDGLLIGYVETESLAAARAGMAATEVNARWQAEMAGYFVALAGAPDTGFLQLSEIFNLDDQLAALAAGPAASVVPAAPVSPTASVAPVSPTASVSPTESASPTERSTP